MLFGKDRKPALAPPHDAVAVPSILSADLIVRGTLTTRGDVHIDGTVEGTVRARSVVIGDCGQIVGEIVASDVTIRGNVEGDIHARRVFLSATSQTRCRIWHALLTIETGARVDVACYRMAPQVEDGAAPRPQPARPVRHLVPGPARR